ncbi:FAD-dependent oxidoreductase [Bradyrhizobium sp. SZCCHNGR1005]|uniref:FAD-dependent oxidoreductase n=2 Tax=unclassified Bradyrhizobium TaxID=2631580 RepID=UPI003967176A
MDKQTRLAEWVDAVRRGELRYCSICDAFEEIGREIAVVGPFGHAIGKALFMRVYSAEVILVPTDDVRDEAGVQQLADAAVQVAPCLVALQRKEGGHRGGVGRRHPRAFRHRLSRDGADVRSELAVQLGVSHTSDGFLKVDDKQRSNVDHLYGIGDVVTDLHQISVAFGHAAVAACHAHHSLPMRYA